MRITPLGIYGPYPAKMGACSSTLAEWGDVHLLLDAGCGSLSRLVSRIPVERLDAVVLTHLHYDHMSDMLPLTYALNFSGREEKLPVYCPDAPDNVRSMLADGPFVALSHADMTLGGAKITFLPGRHPVPAASVRIEYEGRVFVHTGDTNWHDGLVDFCRDADLLMADAGLTSATWHENAPHLSAGMCGELARKAGVRSLLLTHLSPAADAQTVLREARESFPSALLAQELTTYTV